MAAAEVNRVRYPAAQAFIPRATARCVLSIGDVTAGAQLAHDLRIERGLELEVEALECLLEGKAGHADAHGRIAILLAGQFRAEQLFEEVAVRELSLGCVFQKRG
jgi:hypothetical protein